MTWTDDQDHDKSWKIYLFICLFVYLFIYLFFLLFFLLNYWGKPFSGDLLINCMRYELEGNINYPTIMSNHWIRIFLKSLITFDLCQIPNKSISQRMDPLHFWSTFYCYLKVSMILTFLLKIKSTIVKLTMIYRPIKQLRTCTKIIFYL